ncbi:hypothetical protein BGZ61DRAFT_229835 [Ilyonectria robusta]|uniref:uncharacterized protein n=1 Tax=Ilyonectria robusta TaxID=1079257 RepID=UPI001E8EE805|nr:uncharacterized protein BGZ61DRAFT_229835 [Ilyonectria robusta]KAH8651724.1 hypothetical protein BGZ61DRAFT_229835 [Ilyonectria robusta]
MDSICHVCARCFESTETLQKHIQDERSRLIRDVQELCTKPYLPVSSALGILVRYATHSSDLDVEIDLVNPKSDRGHPAPQSIRVHDERDLTCPESFCNYASTNVECDEACPFCSRPLNRVSQFVRHPDDCAARKKRGLEVPDAVSKRQKTLSGQAYNELRLARQDIEPSRRVETNSFSPSPHVSRGTVQPIRHLPRQR